MNGTERTDEMMASLAPEAGGRMLVRPVSDEEYDRLTASTLVPHRASTLWDGYLAHCGGPALWGGYRLAVSSPDGGCSRVVLTLREHSYHHMRYLWADDGPVWLGADPTAAEEEAMVRAVGEWVRCHDRSIDFVRLGIVHHEEVPGVVRPCQEVYGHDTTVVIDLSGDEEALRSRMKPRGRWDINKAGRLCRAHVAEETDIDRSTFETLMPILEGTARRGGFVEHDSEHYWKLFDYFRSQGAARLWVARATDDTEDEEVGTPLAWDLFLVHDSFATYEVAASSDAARRMRAPELILYRAMLAMQAEGVTALDLVAIGSDYNPALNSLTQFKTKFTTEVTRVPAPMELVLRPWRYTMLNKAADIVDSVYDRIKG